MQCTCMLHALHSTVTLYVCCMMAALSFVSEACVNFKALKDSNFECSSRELLPKKKLELFSTK